MIHVMAKYFAITSWNFQSFQSCNLNLCLHASNNPALVFLCYVLTFLNKFRIFFTFQVNLKVKLE